GVALFLRATKLFARRPVGYGGGSTVQDPQLHELRGRPAATAAVRTADRPGVARPRGGSRRGYRNGTCGSAIADTQPTLRKPAAEGDRTGGRSQVAGFGLVERDREAGWRDAGPASLVAGNRRAESGQDGQGAAT